MVRSMPDLLPIYQSLTSGQDNVNYRDETRFLAVWSVFG